MKIGQKIHSVHGYFAYWGVHWKGIFSHKKLHEVLYWIWFYLDDEKWQNRTIGLLEKYQHN